MEYLIKTAGGMRRVGRSARKAPETHAESVRRAAATVHPEYRKRMHDLADKLEAIDREGAARQAQLAQQHRAELNALNQRYSDQIKALHADNAPRSRTGGIPTPLMVAGGVLGAGALGYALYRASNNGDQRQ